MAERLVADSEEIDDFVCDKSAKNWRDKINNLSKKYKTVKDKSKLTVEGSKDIKSFPEFNDLNDIWDKRLIKSQVRHRGMPQGCPAHQLLPLGARVPLWLANVQLIYRQIVLMKRK